MSDVSIISETAGTLAFPNVDSFTSDPINIAAGAKTTVIAAPGASKQIWIYKLFLVANVAGTFLLHDEDDVLETGINTLAAGTPWNELSTNWNMPLYKIATNKLVEITTVTCTIDGTVGYATVSV